MNSYLNRFYIETLDEFHELYPSAYHKLRALLPAFPDGPYSFKEAFDKNGDGTELVVILCSCRTGRELSIRCKKCGAHYEFSV